MKADIERLDQLTRQRLGRLGQVPVDTSGLERRLEAALCRQQRPAARWSGRLVRLAVAAVVAIAAGSALFFQLRGTPVVAAPAMLAQLHRDLVAGQVPLVPVSSIEQANRYLTTEWSEAPPLPDPTAATVTSCCKHNLENRKVACVVLQYNGRDVTMMVGRSRDVVCGAEHKDYQHHGRHYGIHESNGLQMVMIENKGRWVCLMSHASIETLIRLADSLRF